MSMRLGRFVLALVATASAGCSASSASDDGGADSGDVDASLDDESSGGSDAGDDGGTCVPVNVQVVPLHGGGACPMDGSACFPGDVTGFSPVWVPPLRGTPHANVCTNKQIADALADCLGSTFSGSACSAWKTAANMPCYSCLTTAVGASRYGTLISAGEYLLLDSADCIALAEPCNQPCAAAILADFECTLAACNPATGPCQITSPVTASLQSACVTASDSTCGCAGYRDALQCLADLRALPTEHPAVALCALGASSFDEGYTAIATFECGP